MSGSLIVVDASVAAKWLLPSKDELYAAAAVALLDRHVAGSIELFVPDIFFAEMANIVWKAVVRERLTFTQGAEALGSLRRYGFAAFPSLDLLDRAFTIAATFKRSAYDSLYIAAAERFGAIFVTADERLVNAVGDRLAVRWIGSPGMI